MGWDDRESRDVKFAVLVWPTEGFIEPELVGPFPDHDWAKRYVERVLGHRYHKVEIKPMLSPVLIDPAESPGVVFDPEKGIDK